jgi:tetratricopeptide (TPR) repeat protein
LRDGLTLLSPYLRFVNATYMKTISTLCIVVSFVAVNVANAQGTASVKKADSLFFISDYKNAIPIYEAALKVAATNSVAWNRLAYSYQSLGQFDKALANFSKALENNPPAPLLATIESRLSRIYAIRKDSENAFAHLQKAIASGYLNLQELQTHTDFDNIRKDKRFTEVMTTVNTSAFPCLGVPQAREFDFWIGEWDVYPNGANVIVGHSKVEMASGGCMVLENWTALGAVPNTGKSMNYVNSVTGKWEQHWIGSGGLNVNNPQYFTNGEYKDGAMRFESISMSPQNQKQLGRFIFFNMGPDQVRQFYEISADEGKTWTTSYDFIYKRKKG